jgi:hypothetical protein
MSEINPNSSVKDYSANLHRSESHLGAVIPTAKGRKIAYAIYAAIALVVGNTAVGLAAANIEQPVWLVISSAIVANLAAPFAALAIANAKS